MTRRSIAMNAQILPGPSGTQREFYQFAVNSIGAVYDARVAAVVEWQRRERATKRFSDRWTVEMQIFCRLKQADAFARRILGVRLLGYHHGTPRSPSRSFNPVPSISGTTSES